MGARGEVVLRGERCAEGGENGGRVVREEVFEDVGVGECLLDFFGAGEVGEDGRAFDGGAALEMVAGRPGGRRVVFSGAVEGAEVDDGYFVRGRSRGGRRRVDKGPAGVGGWHGSCG